jgi:hypothetical protein
VKVIVTRHPPTKLLAGAQDVGPLEIADQKALRRFTCASVDRNYGDGDRDPSSESGAH